MEHHKIEDEYIIERFVAHELEPEEQREFFEHCLQCADCQKKLEIAGWIDDAIYELNTGRSIVTLKQKPRPIPKFTLHYGAVAALVVIAFVVGNLLDFDKKTKNELATNETVIVDDTSTISLPKENYAEEILDKPAEDNPKNNKPKQVAKPDEGSSMAENKPKVQQKVNEPEDVMVSTYEDANWNLIAMVDDLHGIGDVSKGSSPKGIGNSAGIDSEKVIEKLFEFSEHQNFYIGILEPTSNAEYRVGETFTVAWDPMTPGGVFTVSFIDAGKQSVVKSYKNIDAAKMIMAGGLPRGNYFVVVFNQESKEWQSVKFGVR